MHLNIINYYGYKALGKDSETKTKLKPSRTGREYFGRTWAEKTTNPKQSHWLGKKDEREHYDELLVRSYSLSLRNISFVSELSVLS